MCVCVCVDKGRELKCALRAVVLQCSSVYVCVFVCVHVCVRVSVSHWGKGRRGHGPGVTVVHDNIEYLAAALFQSTKGLLAGREIALL